MIFIHKGSFVFFWVMQALLNLILRIQFLCKEKKTHLSYVQMEWSVPRRPTLYTLREFVDKKLMKKTKFNFTIIIYAHYSTNKPCR